MNLVFVIVSSILVQVVDHLELCDRPVTALHIVQQVYKVSET